jgi:ribonuclease P protein component
MHLALEAAPDPMDRLKKRVQFRAAARGERWVGDAFVLQARRRPDAERAEVPRAGFTASRKVGNAVERNRARRRLKEAARRTLAQAGRPGHDYVLVARRGALAHPFARLLADLETAVSRVHRKLDRDRVQAGDPAEGGRGSPSLGAP